MTQLDVVYRYGCAPSERAQLALSKVRDVYGVRLRGGARGGKDGARGVRRQPVERRGHPQTAAPRRAGHCGDGCRERAGAGERGRGPRIDRLANRQIERACKINLRLTCAVNSPHSVRP